MGRSAWGVTLEPIAGMAQGDADAVKEAAHGALRSEWRGDLGALGEAAVRWIDYDEVYYCELGVDRKDRPSLLFWTYVSVGWPMDLCDHWVDIVLAMGRHTFDRKLGEIGWRFAQPADEVPLPTIRTAVHRLGEKPSRAIYFVHDGAIAKLDGDEVVHQLKLDGTRTERRVALASLPEEERARIHEITKGTLCQCPYCETSRSNFGNYKRDVWQGTIVEPAHWWPSNARFSWIAVAPQRWLCTIDESDTPYLYVTSDGGERFTRVFLPGTNGYRGLRAVTWNGSTVALVLAQQAGKPVLLRTRDAREWSDVSLPNELTAIDGFATAGPMLAVWANGEKSATIALSKNGGDDWTILPAAPDALVHRLVLSEHALWAIVGADHVPAVSVDGGATWSTCSVGFGAEDILLGREPKTACVFGTKRAPDGEKAGAMISRTTDNGATWTVTRDKADTYCHYNAFKHPDGRFYCAPLQCDGLLMSEDDGATWEQITDVEPTSMFSDEANDADGIFYAASYEKLHRITPRRRS